jgi:hypothetical protein
MARDYTTTELIASVRQRAYVALSPRDWTDAAVLRLLNEQMEEYLMPKLAERRLEYGVESSDLTVMGGTAAYQIPAVAMAGKLRAVSWLLGGQTRPLSEIDLPVATSMQPVLTGYPTGYYFLGSQLVLYPTPAMGGTLRVFYYRRPNQLVLPAAVCASTAGSGTGMTVNIASGTLPTAGQVVDIVQARPPFNVLLTTTVVSINTGTGAVVLGAALPSTFVAGDYLCATDTAPVTTGLWPEVTKALIAAVAVRILEAKGDGAALQRAEKGLASAEAGLAVWATERDQGSMRTLSPFADDLGALPTLW